MTPKALNSLINIYCFGKNSSSGDSQFPQADKLILINAFKDNFASRIAQVDEDIFGIIFTDNLIAGQRRYTLPDDILNNIKGLEVKLNGADWQWIREFDLNGIKKPTDEANILATFSGINPMFELFDKSIIIYSDSAIIDVSGGLKLWSIVYPADITDLTSEIDMSVNPSSTSHGFPRQFHELLARRIAIAWKTGQDRPKTLNEKELMFEGDFQLALNSISNGNLDRSIIRTMPKDTGENY